jgi:hypothetical protein
MSLFRTSLFALAFVSLACKPSKTEDQIYAEARPNADKLRAKAIAATKLVEKQAIPASGSSCKPATKKKLTFDPKSDAHDTDFMMFEEAKRGAGKREDGPDEDLDLIFATEPFPRLLRGTHVPSFYDTYGASRSADSAFVDVIKRGGNVKNLILVRSRGSSLDYFLVDLAGPTILCSGNFEASADTSLGTRTDNYDTVTTNKRTGKEVGRVSHTDTHDDYKSALYSDATKKLTERMKTDFGITRTN